MRAKTFVPMASRASGNPCAGALSVRSGHRDSAVVATVAPTTALRERLAVIGYIGTRPFDPGSSTWRPPA